MRPVAVTDHCSPHQTPYASGPILVSAPSFILLDPNFGCLALESGAPKHADQLLVGLGMELLLQLEPRKALVNAALRDAVVSEAFEHQLRRVRPFRVFVIQMARVRPLQPQPALKSSG